MRSAVVISLLALACSPPARPAPAGPTDQPAGPGAQAPAAAAPDPAPPELRLPGDVRPNSYALELTIVPSQQRASGRVKIDARVVRPTRVVWLNATELTIDKATLGGSPARVIAGGEDFVGLTTDRELQPGPLAIDVAFGAPIDHTRSRGIYAEKEGDEAYAYTFFQPVDARRAFPCFDEPNYKVPWQLTFHVKRDHVALANAPVVREADEADGMKRIELEPSKPLPSYLVAFVVGPFELIDGGVAGRIKTPIRFIIPKGRSAELGYARAVTPRVVTALEDYFDMAYPYVKLDVAVVPRFWGTMEHPGIVAMGQPLTLIRRDQETRQRKLSYTNILAHELAHYWFGDYVTMAWWDDTWLNEALGSWMDVIITHQIEPSWRFAERVPSTMGAMASDESLASRALRQPVTTREGIGASFDNDITYAKGAAVLRMFEAAAGRDAWRELMRGYMRKHAWGNASADDLLRAVRGSLGEPIERQLRSFIDQSGVPRISAELSCAAGQPPRLALHQRRSLPAGVADPDNRTWQVPVCVRAGDNEVAGEVVCTTLSERDGTLELPARKRANGAVVCPTWYILNAGAHGYYRSVVDPAVAKALVTIGSPIARVARPSPSEKMMMIADLRAAIERDELAIDQVLALAPAIAIDPDERFARWAFTAGTFNSNVLDDALYEKAKKFRLRTFGPAARKLGWQRAPGDSDERHELRRGFVGLVAEHDRALADQAVPIAKRWLADRTGIADDMVVAVLGAATRRGDQAWFDKLLAAARAPRDRSEQQRLLRALGGFDDPKLARQALDLLLATEFDLRDSTGILFAVLSRRDNRGLGLAFVQAHIDELLGRMRDDEAAGFLGSLADLPCDAERLELVTELVKPRAAKYSGAEGYVSRGLEQSQQCIASFQRQLPALKRFLERE